MIDYDNLAAFAEPEMVTAIRRYIDEHTPVGNFLTALLSNDLQRTMSSADDNNIKHVRDWVRWLYSEAPSQCWGSTEKVDVWLAEYSEDE